MSAATPLAIAEMSVVLDLYCCEACGEEFHEADMAPNHDRVCKGCVDEVEGKYEREHGCNCCGGVPCIYGGDR